MVSRENLGFILNLLMLFSCVSFLLFITVVWDIWDSSVFIAFLSSSMLSFVAFHSLKLMLLKDVHKSGTDEESSNEPTRKSAFLIFTLILLIVVVPIFVLFLIPRLGLPILNGVVCGASLSNLVSHVKMKKKEP